MNNINFILPRRKNTGLNNVVELLSRNVGGAVTYVDNGDGYGLLAIADLYRRLLKSKRRGTLVHSSGIVPDILNRLTGRANSSCTVHNYLEQDYVAQYGRMKGQVATILHAWALKGIDRRVGCSRAVSENLRAVYGISSLPCANGCSDIAAEIKAEISGRTYYFAGPFITRKRVSETLSAIVTHDPTAKARFFGNGPLATELREISAEAPDLLSLREQPAPAFHYEAGHFYISFSAAEGMPLGVLEGLKRGLIPLLSDIPPHLEILEMLAIEDLRTFDCPQEGVKWAQSLSASQRIDFSRQISRTSQAVFGESAFATRFIECIQLPHEN